MIKGNFEIIIASSPEREKVFCEIFYKDQFICDISQESEILLLGIYAPSIQIPFDEFQEAITAAKHHLLGDA